MKSIALVSACVLAAAIVSSAIIVNSGLRQLALSLEHPVAAAPGATTRPAAETLRLLAADEPLRVGDVIEASVTDVASQGVASTRVCRLGDQGTVRLWYLDQIAAVGHGSGELEDKIVKAYRDAQILPRALVVVTARRPLS